MVGGEMETGEDGLVDLGGAPSSKAGSSMQENLHQPDHAGVLDLDAREFDGAYLHGEGQALQEREIHVDIEPLGLVSGEVIGDSQEALAHRWQMIEPLFKPEVCQVVGAKLVSKEGRELLVLPEESTFEIHPEDVMSMLDLFEGGV